MGEDQLGARELAAEAHGVLAERRDAAPRVDQHRHAALVRERDEVAHGGLGEVEALRARVQLDAARAGVQAAGGLGHRAVARVDAAEGDEPPVGRRGGRHHDVVGRRVAVGLVHREHDAARAGAASTSISCSGVCAKPSGSLAPMWVCASNSASPPDLGDQPVVVRLQDPVDVDHEPGRL